MTISHSVSSQDHEQMHNFTLLVHDQSLFNHEAKFQIIRRVTVNDGRAVNSETIVYEEAFNMDSESVDFHIQFKDLLCYDYTGEMVNVHLSAKCIVNNGIIFDTNHSQIFHISHTPPLDKSIEASTLIDPKDEYSLLKNYGVIPSKNKIYIILAAIIAIPLVILNLLFGFMSQITGEYVWVARTDMPAVWSGISGGLSGLAIWAYIRHQFKQYMSFSFKKFSEKIEYTSRIAISDMIKGKSKIALNDIILRVVACNIEKGQYKRGHGTKTRTVSFKNPFRGLVLYEKSINNIPPKMQLGLFFGGHCDFKKMYATLYPPQLVGSSHGIGIYWEIQLIHPNFIDQELVGSNDRIDTLSFYIANEKL